MPNCERQFTQTADIFRMRMNNYIREKTTNSVASVCLYVRLIMQKRGQCDIRWEANYCSYLPYPKRRYMHTSLSTLCPAERLVYLPQYVYAHRRSHLWGTNGYRESKVWLIHLNHNETPKHGPLTRYVKLWVAHALGIPGMFSPQPISKDTAS